MTPQQALKRLGRAGRGATVLRLMHAAPVKSNFLVDRGRERFVLRIDTALAQSFGLDRKAELDMLLAAWRAGVGPEPVAANTDPPAVLLTRYVPGRAWTPRDLRQQRNLQRLADLLRRVHGVHVTGQWSDLDSALWRYAREIGTSESRALATSASRLLANLRLNTGERCLCHHDPIAENVVGFRRTLLIDWEYAGPGDPLFDLAVVIRHHRLTPRATAFFATAYFGSAERVPWKRLSHFCNLYDHILKLWLLVMAGKTSNFAEGTRATLRAASGRLRQQAK